MTSTAALAARKESIPVEALPQTLKIIDCEKRRGVTRYYAYVIEVTRKNRETYHIYRRYKQFDKMVQRLEERFPVEAGSISASDRIIPLLPGKKYIKRSAVRGVAEERIPYLNEFLKNLFLMSDKIRYDSIVLGFLKRTHEDMSNPYRTKVAYPGNRINGSRESSSSPPQRPRPPRLPVGPTRSLPPQKPLPIPCIHVTSTAWKPSYQNKPSKPPPPRPTPPSKTSLITTNKGPRGKALYTYSAKYNDELSFSSGTILTLIRKNDGDWYQCKLEDRIGFVPGNYLQIIEPLPQDQEDESSDDEWDEEESGKITCRYKGRTVTIDIDTELIRRPVYSKLLFAIRSELRDTRITLNYKDKSGDLIEIIDDTDVQLMTEECSRGQRSHNQLGDTSWIIYVTKAGDTSVYNTHPYNKPKSTIYIQ